MYLYNVEKVSQIELTNTFTCSKSTTETQEKDVIVPSVKMLAGNGGKARPASHFIEKILQPFEEKRC